MTLALSEQIHVYSDHKDSLVLDQHTTRRHLSINSSSNSTNIKATYPMDLAMEVPPMRNSLSCNNHTRPALSQICNSSRKRRMQVCSSPLPQRSSSRCSRPQTRKGSKYTSLGRCSV